MNLSVISVFVRGQFVNLSVVSEFVFGQLVKLGLTLVPYGIAA